MANKKGGNKMIALFIVIVALSAVVGGKWIVECYHEAFGEEVSR